MWKFAVRMWLLILLNLFAFIVLWNILDALFETEGIFTVFMIVLSIFPLSIIMMMQISKVTKELKNISPDKQNNEDGANSN